MRARIWILALTAALLSPVSFAAAPADAPKGTTGLCKDGTYYTGETKKGACKGHKGVKEWYGAADTAAPPAKTDKESSAGAAAAAAPPPKPAAAQAEPPAAKPTQARAAAAGGAGKVWVNKSTKVYHCPGDKWYGKTKEGEYMSEAEATAQGFKPDHGKACKGG